MTRVTTQQPKMTTKIGGNDCSYGAAVRNARTFYIRVDASVTVCACVVVVIANLTAVNGTVKILEERIKNI